MNNIKYKNEKKILKMIYIIYRHFYMKFQNLIVEKSYPISHEKATLFHMKKLPYFTIR